jgi:hypothetical protein
MAGNGVAFARVQVFVESLQWFKTIVTFQHHCRKTADRYDGHSSLAYRHMDRIVRVVYKNEMSILKRLTTPEVLDQ